MQRCTDRHTLSSGNVQGGSNMTGTDLCVRLYKSVPVIFEPPCISMNYASYHSIGDAPVLDSSRHCAVSVGTPYGSFRTTVAPSTAVLKHENCCSYVFFGRQPHEVDLISKYLGVWVTNCYFL